MPRWNLKTLSHTTQVSVYSIVLIAVVLSGVYPPIFRDIVIEAPSTVSVGQTFAVSGTSYYSAAERVVLYGLDSREPIGYAVVSTRPPYEFEFEVSVSSDGLGLDGFKFYSGPTEGRTFYFYVQSYQRGFNTSPLAAVTVKG